MGFLRWLRGGDDNTSATSVISAGLAEIDGLFRPSRHKQTEHVEETRRRRVDVATGAGIDLDRGVAVVRAQPGDRDGTPDDPAAQLVASARPRPRTVYQPRRRSLWYRVARNIHRRRRARVAATPDPADPDGATPDPVDPDSAALDSAVPATRGGGDPE